MLNFIFFYMLEKFIVIFWRDENDIFKSDSCETPWRDYYVYETVKDQDSLL